MERQQLLSSSSSSSTSSIAFLNYLDYNALLLLYAEVYSKDTKCKFKVNYWRKNCSLISIELQNTFVLLLQSLLFFWSKIFLVIKKDLLKYIFCRKKQIFLQPKILRNYSSTWWLKRDISRKVNQCRAFCIDCVHLQHYQNKTENILRRRGVVLIDCNVFMNTYLEWILQ